MTASVVLAWICWLRLAMLFCATLICWSRLVSFWCNCAASVSRTCSCSCTANRRWSRCVNSIRCALAVFCALESSWASEVCFFFSSSKARRMTSPRSSRPPTRLVGVREAVVVPFHEGVRSVVLLMSTVEKASRLTNRKSHMTMRMVLFMARQRKRARRRGPACFQRDAFFFPPEEATGAGPGALLKIFRNGHENNAE